MDADVEQRFQGLEKQLVETDKQLGMEAISDALLSPDGPQVGHVAWLRMMAKYCDVLDVDTRWRLAAVAIDYERMKLTLDSGWPKAKRMCRRQSSAARKAR